MAMLTVPRLRSGKNLNLIRDSDVGKAGEPMQRVYLMKENLWRGVTDLIEWVIVAKRARYGVVSIGDSSKQKNQRQEQSDSGQQSTEPD